MEAAYLLCITIEIIHILRHYVVTRSFMNRKLFVYQSESGLACTKMPGVGIIAVDVVLHAAAVY